MRGRYCATGDSRRARSIGSFDSIIRCAFGRGPASVVATRPPRREASAVCPVAQSIPKLTQHASGSLFAPQAGRCYLALPGGRSIQPCGTSSLIVASVSHRCSRCHARQPHDRDHLLPTVRVGTTAAPPPRLRVKEYRLHSIHIPPLSTRFSAPVVLCHHLPFRKSREKFPNPRARESLRSTGSLRPSRRRCLTDTRLAFRQPTKQLLA
jgi:hypothetical protein